MNTTIWAVIGSVLAIIMGLWKMFGRKNEYKRKQADKAKGELNDAHKNKNKSSLLNAWDRINRV